MWVNCLKALFLRRRTCSALGKAGNCTSNWAHDCTVWVCQHFQQVGPMRNEINSCLARAPKPLFEPRLELWSSLWAFNYRHKIIHCLIAYLKFTHEFSYVIVIYWKSSGLQSFGAAFSSCQIPKGNMYAYIGHKHVCIYLFISVTFANNEKNPLPSHTINAFPNSIPTSPNGTFSPLCFWQYGWFDMVD